MLDPLSAISLAGNVVQFVQFSCTIVDKAHQLYRSKDGALPDTLETETVTKRLLQTIEELDDGCKKVASSPKTSTESRLVEIAEACFLVANDMLARLNRLKLKEQQSLWASVSRAFKILWTEDELNSLARRLKAYISELDTTILISMK